MLLLNLVLRAITMYRVREGYDKATVILTTLGSVVGMLPGSWVLKVLPAAQLEVFLGAVLVVATVLLSLQFTLPIKNKPCGRFVAGILSGFSAHLPVSADRRWFCILLTKSCRRMLCGLT